MERRIAFILNWYPLGMSTMVVNSIKLFSQKGFAVDVLIDKEDLDSSPIEFEDARINLSVFHRGQGRFFRAYYRLVARISKLIPFFVSIARKLPFKICLPFFYPHLYLFSRWLDKEMEKHEYDFIIPIECYSLLSLYSYLYPDRILYYNMELLNWDKDNHLYDDNKLVVKNMEYRMIQRVSHVVIQNQQRANLFARINNFDPGKINILPVASMGEPVKIKSTFFGKLFDIRETDKIVIYAGNFAPWARCLEIVESVKHWPEGFVLIMHTWNKITLDTPYGQAMKQGAKGLPVYFSTEYIPYDDMASALSSADIGLMLYQALDENSSEILFSSNKLGEYLKAGLVIIGSDFPSLKNYIEGKKIGAAVNSADDLASLLPALAGQIPTLRENALKCYQEELRFERYFDDFYRHIIAESDFLKRSVMECEYFKHSPVARRP